jgi:G3E family GTPase
MSGNDASGANLQQPETIPITVIGGYLGAGKTTLINRMLAQPTLPAGTAVLVNDFGDINIDAELIKSASPDGQVIGLSNGCICCSISDDLSKALDQLGNLPLQQVIMETSGVAEPARVWQHCHYPGFAPQALVVVVDAENYSSQSKDKYVGQLVNAQVAQADLLIVSKMEHNPAFQLPKLTAQLPSTDPSLMATVFGWTRQHPSTAALSPTKNASFAAQTWQQQQAISLQELHALLDDRAEGVYRVKGWVETTGGTMQVDRVGERLTLKPIAAQLPPAQLGLVFIYSKR